jgi:methyl acetate hydrolase
MPDVTAISELLRRAADAKDVPGVVVAAASADGPIYSGAAGVRNTETGVPMTEDTVVWIASMTKAVTGACAMQLVEQGRLALDAPIADVLPQLAQPHVLEGFAPDGSPLTRPAKRPITLRHLLTHTSGLVYEIWNADMGRYQAATGTPSITTCRNAALTLPLLFDPGDRWDYGIGIDWAGKAVEAVSGQRLGAYMQQNLLQPLGMRDTAFKIGPAQRQRLAKIHSRTPDGFAPMEMELPQEPEFEMGGGGLYSTVGDYLRFTRMMLNGGTLDGVQILSPKTVALFSLNYLPDNKEIIDLSFPGMFSESSYAGVGFSLGCGVNVNVAKTRLPGSLGEYFWGGAAATAFWIDPKEEMTVVFMTQVMGSDARLTLRRDLRTLVYSAMTESFA